jgi:hypothetical protein
MECQNAIYALKHDVGCRDDTEKKRKNAGHGNEPIE